MKDDDNTWKTGLDEAAIHSHITEMIEFGYGVPDEKGWYHLTPHGRDFIRQGHFYDQLTLAQPKVKFAFETLANLSQLDEEALEQVIDRAIWEGELTCDDSEPSPELRLYTRRKLGANIINLSYVRLVKWLTT